MQPALFSRFANQERLGSGTRNKRGYAGGCSQVTLLSPVSNIQCGLWIGPARHPGLAAPYPDAQIQAGCMNAALGRHLSQAAVPWRLAPNQQVRDNGPSPDLVPQALWEPRRRRRGGVADMSGSPLSPSLRLFNTVIIDASLSVLLPQFHSFGCLGRGRAKGGVGGGRRLAC